MLPKPDHFRYNLLKTPTSAHLKAIGLLRYLYGEKIELKQDKRVDIRKDGRKNKIHYYLDIYIRKARIGIEIDGGIHNNRGSQDWFRDENIMNHTDSIIIRFPNEEVLNNPKSFLEKVNQTLINRILYMSNVDWNNKSVNSFLNRWGIPEMRFMDGVWEFVKEARMLQSKINDVGIT